MVAAGQRIVGGNWNAERRSGSPLSAVLDRPPPTQWPSISRAAEDRGLVARAVELEILPRLGIRTAAKPAPALASGCNPASVEEFAGIVLRGDSPRAFQYVDRARAQGLSVEALCLELLAPTARYLGTLWEDDLVDFSNVTLGLVRLHRVLRDLGLETQSELATPHADRHALLVAAPGEQHTFGLSMVTGFFRRAGWTVWSGAPASLPDLTAIARDNWFAVIGFSVGSHDRLESLRDGISQIRRVALNRRMSVMVGGPVFTLNPDLVSQVGADGMAVDGRQAVRRAEELAAPLAARA